MSATDLSVTDNNATENTTYASSNITDGSSNAAEAEADDYYGYLLYQIPSWVFVICAILAIGALLFATIAWIFICVYRKKPIVTMAQPSTYYAEMDYYASYLLDQSLPSPSFPFHLLRSCYLL